MKNGTSHKIPAGDTGLDTEFHRGLGLFDATMVVVGSMIGSGIFIVPAAMSRELGSPGSLLLAWLITAILTVSAALSYGELAAMMPRAGGQYLYLREAFSPLLGFLYGWTLFLVIQTGLIAAVAVAFSRFAGVFLPGISEQNYILSPVHLTPSYAVSMSSAQLVSVLMIVVLTATNICGLRYGMLVQNLFTVTKTGALLGLIAVGLLLGWNSDAVSANFGDLWTPRGKLSDLGGGLTAASVFGLFVALCVSQTGSLFSADAWNCVTFTAGEVRQPRRNLPLSLALGTSAVLLLYMLANLAYLVTLPFADIQQAENDRVATVMLARIFPTLGVPLMAAAIMISTFGCNNGLILAGARAYYAMARDGLFFARAGRLNAARVPAWGLIVQGVWAALLVLPRTYNVQEQTYGNLYSDLLDYIVSAALVFYVLTIAGVYRLRMTRPNAERPYRAFGYPLVPALYIIGATVLVAVLVVYRPMTTWPGMAIVLLGLPVYFVWQRRR
ncbi:MAG TPA: amino acid permease [Gemmataceae bacterium]|jgi:APA family basic amino acid/polyamine antiporter